MLAIFPVAAIALLTLGYVGASAYVYDQVTAVPPRCGDDPTRLANTPAEFKVRAADADASIDTAPYAMPEYEDVRFPSRDDPAITIAAWWVPASEDPAPGASAITTTNPAGVAAAHGFPSAVILVHGHKSCRHEPEVLFAGGMLHRAGFSVLLIDLRDQGDSTVDDGRYAGGSEEYLDVLGAFDWLLARGIPANRIGVAGLSLGAATAMIAAGEEPGIAAVWEDSGFGDIRQMARDELEFQGFPALLEPGAILYGQVATGVDIAARSPLDEVRRLDGRPIFITHGQEDDHIRVHFAHDLAQAVREDGGTVEPWIVEGAGHTRAITIVPAEYESRLIAFFSAALLAP